MQHPNHTFHCYQPYFSLEILRLSDNIDFQYFFTKYVLICSFLVKNNLVCVSHFVARCQTPLVHSVENTSIFFLPILNESGQNHS